MESHGKYAQFIYAHSDDELYVNLFMASRVTWHAKGITLRQETTFPDEEHTRLEISVGTPIAMTLQIRYPAWVAPDKLMIKINGQPVAIMNKPGSYVPLKRTWRQGDRVDIDVPMQVRLERLMGNYPLFDAIIQFTKETKQNGKPLCKNTLIRHKLAQLQIEFEIGRLLTYRVILVMDEGRAPNVEASMAKAYCTAFEQHLATTATDILGLYGQLVAESKWAPILGMAPHSFLGSKGYSLQGGTSEVLRNIIASRGLGLPAGG